MTGVAEFLCEVFRMNERLKLTLTGPGSKGDESSELLRRMSNSIKKVDEIACNWQQVSLPPTNEVAGR